MGEEVKEGSPEVNSGPAMGEEMKECSPEEEGGSIGSGTKIDLGENDGKKEEVVRKANGGRSGSENIAYMILKRLPNKASHETAL